MCTKNKHDQCIWRVTKKCDFLSSQTLLTPLYVIFRIWGISRFDYSMTLTREKERVMKILSRRKRSVSVSPQGRRVHWNRAQKAHSSLHKLKQTEEERRRTKRDRGTPVAWCGLIGVSGESVIQTSVSFNVGIRRDRDKEKQGREEEVKECSLMSASSGTRRVFQRKRMRANLWPLEKTAAPAGPRHIVLLSSGMADEFRLVQHLLLIVSCGQQHPNAHTEFTILKCCTRICTTFPRNFIWAKVLIYSQLLSIRPTSFLLFLHSCVRKCWRRQGFHVVSIYQLRPFLRDCFIFHRVSAGSHICCVTMTRTTRTCCCNYL